MSVCGEFLRGKAPRRNRNPSGDARNPLHSWRGVCQDATTKVENHNPVFVLQSKGSVKYYNHKKIEKRLIELGYEVQVTACTNSHLTIRLRKRPKTKASTERRIEAKSEAPTITIQDVYPELDTNEGIVNLLNHHPDLLEKGIPLSILNDLTDPVLPMSDTMLLILKAVNLKQPEVLVKGSVKVTELRELGYIVKVANVADTVSISGWIVPESF